MDNNTHTPVHPFEQPHARTSPKKKKAPRVIAVLIGLVLIYYLFHLVAITRNAGELQSLMNEISFILEDRDFEQAHEKFTGGLKDLNQLERSLKLLYPLTKLPYIENEIKAAYATIDAARITLNSAAEIMEWAQQIPVLSKTHLSSFGEISPKEREQFLSEFKNANALWDRIYERSTTAIALLSYARESTRLPSFSNRLNGVIEQLSSAQNAFLDISPWLAHIPDVVGYPKEKTYLLLLQNNTELRPTGGFIGTFGVLTLKNGDVQNFTTENVYNLDEPAKAYNSKIPPEPLQRYIKQSQWFFRDVNWDPDFPTTAKKAIQFYHDERGPIRHFDGVIALTPSVIEDLIEITGPVMVDGKEFTAENLIELLAYHVERGFKEEGITIYNRKEIIDKIAQQLKDRVFNMSTESLRALAPKMLDAFSEKQLMVYFVDSSIQQVVERVGWDNRINAVSHDYAYVVDANLGSLKTDPYIERIIDYTIVPNEQGAMTSNITITYKNHGTFDWKTTRYRTYTRIYLPQGVTLVDASGNEERITVSQEHGKTVFGTFISIEPRDVESLSFTYTLPQNISDKIYAGDYELLFQKQAGTKGHELRLHFTMPFNVRKSNVNKNIDIRSERVNAVSDLTIDRIFHLEDGN